MRSEKLALLQWPLLALALMISLLAVHVPLAPAQANNGGPPVSQGNLGWAPMYLNGTSNTIVLTDCPETVSFAWERGEPQVSRYTYQADDSVCFTMTFQNLDAVDHNLDFTWLSGQINGADWTITPNPVIIPGGATADVTFCCDLSDTTTYPAFQFDDWYGWYHARFDVGYDGLHATLADFSVCVLPADGSVPVMPMVGVALFDIDDGIHSVENMRNLSWSEGMHWFYALIDSYSHDKFFDNAGCGLMEIYNETDFQPERYAQTNSEMSILNDGSVKFTDHATLTGGLSDVTWDRIWHHTHDGPFVKVTDVYTNNGTDPVSFSASNYLINYADDGVAVKVPGVYDEWTTCYRHDRSDNKYYPTIPPIMADDMAAPAIFECDATGYYSMESPGAFGAIVFPTELPYFRGTEVFPEQLSRAHQGTALYFAHPGHNGQIFSYRYDLAPGGSKTIEIYYVLTGSYSNSSYGPEEELYDVVYSLLSWPIPAISLSPDQGVGAFTIEGQGFRWNSEITITWDETPIPGGTSSEWAGEFSAVVSVPEQTEAGNHTVTVSDGTNSASAIFTVPDMTGPAGDTGPPGPAGDTGPSGPAGGIGLSIAAIVLGAIAIIASVYILMNRKRQSRIR
ncbi:collagen-like protein [Chloroflexota bacterium]